jgi:hypothetical protein
LYQIFFLPAAPARLPPHLQHIQNQAGVATTLETARYAFGIFVQASDTTRHVARRRKRKAGSAAA